MQDAFWLGVSSRDFGLWHGSLVVRPYQLQGFFKAQHRRAMTRSFAAEEWILGCMIAEPLLKVLCDL